VLLLFTVAMLGVVCAGDVITLFVFWELTSITSYLLIGFDHERAAARAAALQALLVTGGGGLALLAGLLLLGQLAGGYELWRLIEQSPASTPARSICPSSCWCWPARSPSRRRCRSTSGCRRRWSADAGERLTSIRRRW
jgi:multicomponent Na+:H+ antiporter subunit A